MLQANIFWAFLSVILILASIRSCRIFFRTKQIGILLIAFGALMGSIGLVLDILNADISIYILFTAYIFITLGLILQGSLESGTRDYVMKNTTFYQRLVGSVPKIENFKKPVLKKKRGILLGLLTIGIGLLGLFIEPEANIIVCLNIIWGILIIVSSFIWGVNEEKSPLAPL
jgi:sulfite exporter TauE/SafE